MKKLLFIIPLLVLFFSCNKKEEIQPIKKDVAALIRGEWDGVSQKYEFYDADNIKKHEDNSTADWYYKFDNIEYIFLDANGLITSGGTYTVEKQDNKDYLILNYANETKVEIVDISETEMTWKVVESNQTYIENDLSYISAKSIVTAKFIKK